MLVSHFFLILINQTDFINNPKNTYASISVFGGWEAAQLVTSRRDCSACKGTIPLWKPQEGRDAAIGSARDAELTAVAVWELRCTQHDKFSGLRVGRRHREEAAHG